MVVTFSVDCGFRRKFDFFDGGSPEDGSFADRGFGLPIDFKASGGRAGGGGPKHAKEGTNAMHAGWTGPFVAHSSSSTKRAA